MFFTNDYYHQISYKVVLSTVKNIYSDKFSFFFLNSTEKKFKTIFYTRQQCWEVAKPVLWPIF